nr:tetratricopeptide repeat protein [Streptoalloteichus tenebrarius]
MLRRAVPSLELRHANGFYKLEIDETFIDFWQFRALVREAGEATRHGEYDRARVLLHDALGMWETPLADLDTRWADSQRRRLTSNVLLPAQYALLENYQRLQDHQAVLELVDEIQDEHTLDQKLATYKIRSLHALARYQEAISFFLDFRRWFTAETGAAPCAELQALHERSMSADQMPAAETNGAAAEAVVLPANLEIGATGGDLPHDIWNFAGREDLLAELDHCLDRWLTSRHGGLIALDGFPGIGKTTLVIHWAHRARERLPGGQVYLDLRGFASESRIEPAEAVVHLLTARGVNVKSIPSSDDRWTELRNQFGGQRALVVLDNVTDSAHVRPLLAPLSSCLVVVTSRNQLSGLALRHGAHRMTLRPLSDDQTAEWLRNHIGRRAHTEPKALQALVTMCGGLPLAMQLVGQHVSSHHERSLSDLVAELRHQRSMLLLGGEVENPILRTVFSWSYEALPDDAKRLFRLLGLHPTPEFSLHVATALNASTGPETQRHLDVLVGTHLIHQISRDRYRMHDLLWEYARNHILTEDAPSRHKAAVRMLDWYLYSSSNAEKAFMPHVEPTPVPPPSHETRPLHVDGPRAALRWVREEEENLIAVVQQAERLGLHHHAALLPSTFVDILLHFGHYEELVLVFTVAVRAAKAARDKDMEASAFNNLGSVHQELRDYEEADTCFRKSYALYEALGDVPGCSAALHNLGTTHIRRRRYPEGIEFYRRSLSLAVGTGLPGEEVRASRRLAWAYAQARRYTDASPQYQHAWQLSRTIGDLHMQGTILAELGELHYLSGDTTAAEQYCREALAIHRRRTNLSGAGLAYTVLAQMSGDRDQWEESRTAIRIAIACYRQARDPEGEAQATDVLGLVLRKLGLHEAAGEAWKRAVDLYQELGHPRADTLRDELGEVRAELPALPPARRAALTRNSGIMPKRT